MFVGSTRSCAEMSTMKQSPIFSFCFAVTCLTSGLLTSSLQGILYFVLRPFDRNLFRKLNWYLAATFYSQFVFLAEWWAGMEVLVYVDRDDYHKYYGKEHGMFIVNHKYDIDWLVGWYFSNSIRCMGGIKGFLKKELQYIPALGWSFYFSEMVFLKRSFDKDEQTLKAKSEALMEFPDPSLLFVCPEGTRFTADKHKLSQKVAQEKGLPDLKHHLLPRTKGFTTSLPFVRRNMKAVYDLVFSFDPKDPVKPTISNVLMGRRLKAHLYIKRIPIEEVPEGDEAAKFLYDMFVRKDKMQDSFFKTGSFFTESGVTECKPFLLRPRLYTLVNMVLWLAAVLLPMCYYTVSLLVTGKWVLFSILFGFLCIAYLLTKKLINMTEIGKGSSAYGAGSSKKKL